MLSIRLHSCYQSGRFHVISQVKFKLPVILSQSDTGLFYGMSTFENFFIYRHFHSGILLLIVYTKLYLFSCLHLITNSTDEYHLELFVFMCSKLQFHSC